MRACMLLQAVAAVSATKALGGLLDSAEEELTADIPMFDRNDPLKSIEFVEPGSFGASSLMQMNMRTAAEGVISKAKVAHRQFAEQWTKQMTQIDKAGILTAPELSQFAGVAKAKMAALIQKTSDSELNGTEADTSMYEGMRLGVVRFMCTVQSVNLLEPYDSESTEAADFVGSGFVIAMDAVKGPLIVTNAHVVSDAESVKVQVPSNGQQPYVAQAVLVNHDWDIALVRILPKEWEQLQADMKEGGHDAMPVFKLSDGKAASGIEVTAMGFPLGSQNVAITMGIVSGQEDVSGNVVYQQTAPISPGNSGGPLFKKGTDEVIGINFAAAASELAQNVNYAIPSWRVLQAVNFFTAHGDTHNIEACQKAPVTCEMDVTKVNAVTVPGNDEVYAAYGCQSGVLLSKIAERSPLHNADPPVTVDSFITSVNGIHLDKYGMGSNPDFVADPVHFHDLMYMSTDISASPAEVTTCSCGVETKHKVDLSWSDKYKAEVPDHAQPYLSHLAFERFGDLTVQPLNVQLAKALVMQAGMVNLVEYVLNVDHKPVLIVTSAPEMEDADGAMVQIGSIITKVNGKSVLTLEEFREAFDPTGGGATCGASGDTASLLQNRADKAIWMLETLDGAFYAAPFQKTMARMVKDADAEHPLTPTSRTAAEKLGLDVSHITGADSPSTMEGSLMEFAAPRLLIRNIPSDLPLIPIEARNIERGGRTRKMTMLERIQAVVPKEQLFKIAKQTMDSAKAVSAREKAKHDKIDERNRKTHGMVLLESDEEANADSDEDEGIQPPNWWEGLIDMTKPLASGFGV